MSSDEVIAPYSMPRNGVPYATVEEMMRLARPVGHTYTVQCQGCPKVWYHHRENLGWRRREPFVASSNDRAAADEREMILLWKTMPEYHAADGATSVAHNSSP